jgi:hypothetical protein
LHINTNFMLRLLAGPPLLVWGAKYFSWGPETDLGGPDEKAVLRGVFW